MRNCSHLSFADESIYPTLASSVGMQGNMEMISRLVLCGFLNSGLIATGYAGTAEMAEPKDGKAHPIGSITYAAPGGAKLIKGCAV